MKILGIDPGIRGGLAIIEDGKVIETLAMPSVVDSNGVKIIDSFKVALFMDEAQVDEVFIEDVHAIYGAGAKSTFNFGRNVGMIESIILVLGYELEKIKPKDWQQNAWRGIDRILRKDGSKDTKAISLLSLYKHFPEIKKGLLLETSRCRVPHDGIVDAILIAKFN